jgi:gluconate 2-dehydrogenase gamma chain
MSEPKADSTENATHPLSRRSLVKGLALVPLAAVGLPGCSAAASDTSESADTPGERYTPTFFKAEEWAFIVAACDRLIPHDEHGPGAVELGVPEFIDRDMQTPYASGDIWYMQGPFVEAPPELGYQGRLTLRDILRVGLGAADAHCRRQFDGKTFAALEPAQQEAVLKSAESGELQLEGISSKVFFAELLAEVRNGYFSDPVHGGNKGMGSWKMIGYPGMRADYTDWVEVRDKPYPLPPVDLAGRRG